MHGASVDRPKQVVRDAVRTWNRMAKTIGGWPRKQLPLTDNRGWRALPMSAFPKAFEEDCESYLNRSEGLGLFDERGLQKLSDATKVDRRNKLLQLATSWSAPSNPRLPSCGSPISSSRWPSS